MIKSLVNVIQLCGDVFSNGFVIFCVLRDMSFFFHSMQSGNLNNSLKFRFLFLSSDSGFSRKSHILCHFSVTVLWIFDSNCIVFIFLSIQDYFKPCKIFHSDFIALSIKCYYNVHIICINIFIFMFLYFQYYFYNRCFIYFKFVFLYFQFIYTLLNNNVGIMSSYI